MTTGFSTPTAKSIVLATLACLGVTVSTALAQTTVPNTFLPDTPARAAEINANFQALATAIDGVAAPLLKESHTNAVGLHDLGIRKSGHDGPKCW